jgi:hypothetical protein
MFGLGNPWAAMVKRGLKTASPAWQEYATRCKGIDVDPELPPYQIPVFVELEKCSKEEVPWAINHSLEILESAFEEIVSSLVQSYTKKSQNKRLKHELVLDVPLSRDTMIALCPKYAWLPESLVQTAYYLAAGTLNGNGIHVRINDCIYDGYENWCMDIERYEDDPEAIKSWGRYVKEIIRARRCKFQNEFGV